MARGAGIGDFVPVGHGRRDEAERVRSHLDVGDRSLDRGHVAVDALASWRAVFVVSVRFERCRSRSIG